MDLTHDRSQGLLNKEPEYFSSGDYLLGIVKRAIAAKSNMEISLPHMGEVTVFPVLGTYFAAVPNMAEFCQTHASRFKTIVLGREVCEPRSMAGTGRGLSDLLWQAAFYASRGRLVESHSNGEPVQIYDVIRFHHWPNLTRLPMTPNTMRICALLTRQPSSIALVPRRLRIDPEEVFQIYSAACSSGIVHVVSDHLGQAELDDRDEPADPADGGRLLHSLFMKTIGL